MTDDDDSVPGCLWLAALVCVAVWTGVGCGASAAVRASYAAETERCMAAESAIVARQGTTEAEDRADLAALRAECDAHLAAIGGGP